MEQNASSSSTPLQPPAVNDGLAQFITCTAENPSEMMSLAFYRSQPRNLVSGCLRALSNLVVGVGLGMGGSCMLAAREYQRRRYLVLIAGSLFTMISTSAVGGVFAAQQVAKGLMSSIESITNPSCVWDETLNQWHTIYLREAEKHLPFTDEDLDEQAREAYRNYSETHSDHAAVATAETEDPNSLYAIIGVPRTATPEEIRKAYRTKALALHPDKCGNTPEANVHFQNLCSAYAVLSNPATREEYHQRPASARMETDGSASPASPPSPSVMLASQLQLTSARPLVGPLAALLFFQPFHFYSHQLRIEKQHRREVRLALTLSEFLKGEEGMCRARAQAEEAAECSLSRQMLPWVAEEYADVSHKFFLRSLNRSWSDFTSGAKGSLRSVRHLWNAWTSFQQGQLQEDGGALACLVSLSEESVRLSVRQAAHMVLWDASESVEVREGRAKNLKALSTIIEEVLQR